MKITSYFTESELDLLITIFYDLVSSDEDSLAELSVGYDAGDKLVRLKEKVEFFKTELQNESPQE